MLGSPQLNRIPLHQLSLVFLKENCKMFCDHEPKPATRREALSRLGQGFGLTALAAMTQNAMAQAASDPTAVGVPGVLTGKLHFKPRAKRVIFLFMNGGVSHIDS